MNKLLINKENIEKIYIRVTAILDIIKYELDDSGELNVSLNTLLEDAHIIDNMYQFKLVYSNYITGEEKDIIINLTEYEINDLNVLYRFLKNSIIYNEDVSKKFIID